MAELVYFFIKKPNELLSGGKDLGSHQPPISGPIADPTGNPSPNNGSPSIPGPDPIVEQDPKPSPRQQSAVVSIFSDPSEAEIYIDDENIGHKTPYRITKSTNREYRLKLVKPGYFPLEKNFTLNRPVNTLDNRLVLERYGFVNLNVIGGGSAPVVEINGQIVAKKPPINMHKVPAGIPITIRVNNEYLNMSAAETITVNENQKKLVELVLKSSQ